MSKLSTTTGQKKEAENRPSLVVSGRAFKVVPQPLPGQEIPGRGPHITMAQPLLDSSNRSAVKVTERGEGVSELMRGNLGCYASFTANSGKGFFSVRATHWLPAAPVADKKVSVAGVTGRNWDEGAILSPELKIAVGGFSHRYFPLLVSLALVYKDHPILKVQISHPDANSLSNPKSTIEHHRVKSQVSNLPPTPMGVGLFSGSNNPLDLAFKVGHKMTENLGEWRPGEITRPAWGANFVQRVISNKPATVTKPDEISKDAVVGMDCVGFIFSYQIVFNEPGDVLRARWPGRAKRLVNPKNPPVL